MPVQDACACRGARTLQVKSLGSHCTLPCPTCLPPRSDPAHFPTILAYLRDGRLPALPNSQLELRQLAAEADFFAMTELAAACRAPAKAAEAEARARSLLVVQQAEAVRAACEAVEKAQAGVDKAEAVLAPLRALEAEERRLQELYEAAVLADEEEAALQLEAVWQDAEYGVDGYKSREDVKLEREILKDAQARLRAALLARLCALGAELPAAEAQLQATHPHLRP